MVLALTDTFSASCTCVRFASNLFSLSLSLKLIRHHFLKVFANTNRSCVKPVDVKMLFVLYFMQTRKFSSR